MAGEAPAASAAPAWGSGTTAGAAGTVETQMKSTVGQLAPLATQWNGQQQTFAQYTNPSSTYAKAAGPSWVSAAVGKVEALGNESAHLVEGASSWIANQGKTAVESVPKLAVNAYKLTDDAYHTYEYRNQSNALSDQLQQLQENFKLGRINHTQYSQALQGWVKDNQALQENMKGLTASIGSAGKNITQATINVASSIVTIMTAGGSAAVDVGSKEAADFLMSDAAKSITLPAEDLLSKMATNAKLMEGLSDTGANAVKDSLYNVLFSGAKTMTAGGLSRAAAGNLLLKYPLTFNMLSGTGNQVYKELQNDKYGDAIKTVAFNAALLLSGGPIGQAFKYGGGLLKGLSDATFGETTFLDTFAEALGKDSQKFTDAINDGGGSYARNWRAFEATNINAESGNVKAAVYRVVDAWRNAGRPIDQMTEKDIIEEANTWANIQGTVHDTLVRSGMSEEDASRVVIGRWTALDKNNVAEEIGKYPDRADRLQAWENLKQQNPNAAYSNNKSLDDEVKNSINNTRSASAAAKRIKNIEASFKAQGRVANYLKGIKAGAEKLGYVFIEPQNLEAPFKEGEGAIKTAVNTDSDFFTRATTAPPVLAHIGSFLTSMGLSPVVATQRVQDLFTNSFTQVLGEKGLLNVKNDEDSDLVLKKLGNFMKQKTIKFGDREVSIVNDYRALTLKDIGKALNVTKEDAKGIRSALNEAMLRVPIQVRGAGDRIMDWNYKLNPVAKWYTKIQGATRFAWNPIFQARVSYKYEILSQLRTEGKPLTLLGTHNILSRIFPEYYNRLPEIDKILEDHGVYGAGQQAEASEEGEIAYKSTAHTLYGSQRRTISSLVATMADRAGMDVKDFIKSFPDETRDAVRTITEYDPKGDFLNSPLTRTLNYAFFPFRFNVKVSTAIVKVMVKQPAVVQFALIKGMMQAHQFLNSKEGMAWYSQNADVIGLAEYFTPLETVSTVAQIVGHPGSIMDYGELGGLPFGWISGLLEAEGIIKSQPYVSPTSGQTLPDYIPADTRGRFAAAIEDLLGTLYTYPGSTLGMTSKGKIDENIADWFVPGHTTSDFQAITPTNLTPQQQEFQQVVQQAQGAKKNVQQALKQQPQSTPTTTNVPAQSSSITSGPGTKLATAPKKKKGQFIPQLLPGQTQLGQIP